MPTLSKAQLAPTDPVLNKLASHIRPSGFIHDILFPPLNVTGETGKIPVWTSNNAKLPLGAHRYVGAEANVIQDPEPSYVTFTIDYWAEKLNYTAREMRIVNAQGVGAEMLKEKKLSELQDTLYLKKEYDLATKLTTSANYETSYSAAVGTAWSDTNGDPVGDIETGISQLLTRGVMPNVIAFDAAVWVKLARHSAILEMTKSVQLGKATPQAFYDCFGLWPIISTARYVSGSTWTKVWGTNAILAHVEGYNTDFPLSGNRLHKGPTFGRTLQNSPTQFKEYADPKIDMQFGAWIEGEMNYAFQFVGIDNATDGDSISGYLMTGVISS